MNENCLKGFHCPKCGSEGPFRIAGSAWFDVVDDGVEATTEVEWDTASVCICIACGFDATVGGFTLEESEENAEP